MNYLEILDSYYEEMLKSLGRIVSFRSVNSPGTVNNLGELCPYGIETAACLKEMLGLGNELGFSSENVDNYAGHIEWKSDNPDTGSEIMAIVGHLDVVPAEPSGWNSEPFDMVVKDGFAYGRGVADDKGPLIACLYAMKALKESGYSPARTIRLIAATDEEIGEESIRYYLERKGQPDIGFTPDSGFPLINGELGILNFDLAQKLKPSGNRDGLRLTRLQSGTAYNAVPATAKAVVTASEHALYDAIRDKLRQFEQETDYKLSAKRSGNSMIIEAQGVAAHGAHPHEGLNAISILMAFLGQLDFNSDDVNDFIDTYNSMIGFRLDGSGIGCALSDRVSGSLIFNVGLAQMSEELATLGINIRYPVTCTEEQVYQGLEEAIRDRKLGIVRKNVIKPLYMDAGTELVSGLMKAYVDETGDTENGPLISPGGTYAKAVNNTLAFGALFPGETDTMHQANERLSLESFRKMARIYARAIVEISSERN